jgi:hypothetical protein
MSETLPEDDGTMRINGVWCRPDHMDAENLKDLRDKCFESITARCAEIQLLNEVIENDTV